VLVQLLQTVLPGLSQSVEGSAVLKASLTKAFYLANDQDYAPVSAFIRQFEATVRSIESQS